MPRAFITGITGQDGQHLAQFLHSRGYDVYGLVKGQSNPRIAAVVEEMPYIETVPGDLAGGVERDHGADLSRVHAGGRAATWRAAGGAAAPACPAAGADACG